MELVCDNRLLPPLDEWAPRRGPRSADHDVGDVASRAQAVTSWRVAWQRHRLTRRFTSLTP